MSLLPQGWREFVRDTDVLEQRRHSLAFVEREQLGFVELIGNTKIFTKKPAHENDWVDPDSPSFVNAAAPLVSTATLAWCDNDLDCKPPSGYQWTDDYRAAALKAHAILSRAYQAFPIKGLTFGRESMQRQGHTVCVIGLDTPEDMLTLRRLTMARPVDFRGISVRLEVRVAAEKGKSETGKCFTLPGSTYPLPGDEAGFDLIAWELPPGTVPLGHTSLTALRLAHYAWLMTIAVLDHWSAGNRHATGLYVTGALAHEVQSGFLSEEQALVVLRFVMLNAGDDDPHDREKMLADSIRALGEGRPVSGYTKLKELVGEELQKALLRMRGGSDPDAIAEMYRRIISVRNTGKDGDRYLDLSGGATLSQDVTADTLLQRYSNHPEFPPLVGKKGAKLEIIRAVLTSPTIQRVNMTVELPGAAYASRHWLDGNRFIEATDSTPAPVGAITAINTAPGLPEVDEPTEAEKARWLHFWDRHAEPLVDDLTDQYALLEQPLAWKFQRPMEKRPLGVALCGGQGIGKSALFDVVMRELMPGLIGKSAGFDLKERFRLQGLGRCLHYVIEEIDFEHLDKAMHELFKNLAKNDTIPIEYKYGKKGNDRNVAIPWFLTNSTDPHIIVDGKTERSLLVVLGATHMSRGGSLKDWADYARVIEQNVTEFAEALQNEPRLRNAGRWYFLNLPLDNSIFTRNVEATESDHIRSSMDNVHKCLLAMFEEDRILPDRTDCPITGPFTLRLISEGVDARMRKRGLKSPAHNEQRIGKMLRDLFKTDAILREKRVMIPDAEHKEKQIRVRYFGLRIGSLLDILRKNSGIELEYLYGLVGADYGEADEPDKGACKQAWETSEASSGRGSY